MIFYPTKRKLKIYQDLSFLKIPCSVKFPLIIVLRLRHIPGREDTKYATRWDDHLDTNFGDSLYVRLLKNSTFFSQAKGGKKDLWWPEYIPHSLSSLFVYSYGGLNTLSRRSKLDDDKCWSCPTPVRFNFLVSSSWLDFIVLADKSSLLYLLLWFASFSLVCPSSFANTVLRFLLLLVTRSSLSSLLWLNILFLYRVGYALEFL